MSSSSIIDFLYYCHLLEDLTAAVLPTGGFLEPDNIERRKAKVGTPKNKNALERTK